jgi:hypothetical protein
LAIPPNIIRRTLTAVLVGYWLALFAATHLPIPASMGPPGSDKWHHFAAYAGLSILLAARLACNRSFTWKLASAMLGVVALFGAIDELSQIPAGRDAEIGDLLADVFGAVIGLFAFGIPGVLLKHGKKTLLVVLDPKGKVLDEEPGDEKA